MINNKVRLIGITTLLITSLVGCENSKNTSMNKVINIETHGSFQHFDYQSLKKEASTIALVEIQDNLDKNNSTFRYVEGTNFVRDYFSLRKAKVLKYYKNEKKLGENLSFIEPAAINEENKYFHPHDYDTFEKGKQYIIFLKNSSIPGELSIISANNGKVYTKDLTNNINYEIGVKTAIEFETSDRLSKDIRDALLNATIPTQIIDSSNSKKEILETNLGPVNIEYTYNTNDDDEYVEINGMPLLLKGKHFTK